MASLFKLAHHTVTYHTVLHNTGTLHTTAVLINYRKFQHQNK